MDQFVYLAILVITTGAVGKLWIDLKAIAADHLACKIKQAELEAHVAGLRREIDILCRTDRSEEGDTNAWIITDMTGKVVDAGGRIMSMLGYQAKECISRDVDFFVPPSLREAHHKGLAEVAAGRAIRSAPIVGHILRKDQIALPVLVHLALCGHDGNRSIRARFFEIPD